MHLSKAIIWRTEIFFKKKNSRTLLTSERGGLVCEEKLYLYESNFLIKMPLFPGIRSEELRMIREMRERAKFALVSTLAVTKK